MIHLRDELIWRFVNKNDMITTETESEKCRCSALVESTSLWMYVLYQASSLRWCVELQKSLDMQLRQDMQRNGQSTGTCVKLRD